MSASRRAKIARFAGSVSVPSISVNRSMLAWMMRRIAASVPRRTNGAWRERACHSDVVACSLSSVSANDAANDHQTLAGDMGLVEELK